MIMKYSLYTKKPLLLIDAEDTHKLKDSNKHFHSPLRDQFNQFTDLFIRRGIKQNHQLKVVSQKTIPKEKIHYHKHQNPKQNNNFFIQTNNNNQGLKLHLKDLHKTVNCEQNKNSFDSKFITPKSKPKINTQFNSDKRKQQMEKQQSLIKKNHLSNDDAVKSSQQQFLLSLRGSGRYAITKEQRRKVNQNNQQQYQLLTRNQKKLIDNRNNQQQLKVSKVTENLITNTNYNNNNNINNIHYVNHLEWIKTNNQQRQKSLLTAYKIKSLVLEKNPRQQMWQRTRKYIGRQSDLRNKDNKSTIYNTDCQDSARPQSQHTCSKKFLLKIGIDQSKLMTMTGNNDSRGKINCYCRDEIGSSRISDNGIDFVTPKKTSRTNTKPNNNSNSKTKSIDPLASSYHHTSPFHINPTTTNIIKTKKDDTLQPWSRNSNTNDHHDIILFGEDIILEQSVDLSDRKYRHIEQNTLHCAQQARIADNMSCSKTGRNSYRKIYSKKEKNANHNKSISKDGINTGK